MSVQSGVHDNYHQKTGDVSPRFSDNSETKVSELLENVGDVCPRRVSSTCVLDTTCILV